MFAVDTSGSMSRDDLSDILSELLAFRQSFPCKLTLIQCDSQVKHVETHEAFENHSVTASMTFHGRGGTSFKPVFNWIRDESDNDVSLLIYATDGYGVFPDERVNTPTFWLVTPGGEKADIFPFGQVLKLEDQHA